MRYPVSKFDEYHAKGREAETQAILTNDLEIKRQLNDIAQKWFDLAERVKRKDQ